jgi:hypothetical protein
LGPTASKEPNKGGEHCRNRQEGQTSLWVEIVALDAKGSPISLDTGFFISPEGIVVTNCHVIQGASSLAAFDYLATRGTSSLEKTGVLFGWPRVAGAPTAQICWVTNFSKCAGLE